VLVVEAGMKSGAMLTVKWALDQDREVFAVPGNVVSETSAGTNWLIQQGARLVTGYRDVLEELNLAALGASVSIERQAAESGSPQSQLGVDSLAREENGLNNIESGLLGELRAAAGPVHIDELTRTVRQPASAVGAAMAVLELKGLVTQTGPMQFSAQRERARQAQTWK
jgi:DNA processing protein